MERFIIFPVKLLNPFEINESSADLVHIRSNKGIIRDGIIIIQLAKQMCCYGILIRKREGSGRATQGLVNEKKDKLELPSWWSVNWTLAVMRCP